MEAATVPLQALMEITSRPPQVFVRGEGSWLVDADSRRYLWNEPSARLAALLTAHSCFDRVFFASSGAEANEGAIKLARKWGARHGVRAGDTAAFEIVTFEHAFHGRTLATMSASGKPNWDGLFEPRVPGFPKARLNDLDSVIEALTERTVGVMLEPVQGEAGVLPATDRFLRQLRDLTRERGLLLIVDEVQTGVGRTGPLVSAAGCAVAQTILAPGFLDGVVARGRYLGDGLRRLSRAHGLGAVRGRGLLLALDLQRNLGESIVAAARESGYLINAPRPDSLRFMPALTVTDDEIDRLLEGLHDVLAAVLGTAPKGALP